MIYKIAIKITLEEYDLELSLKDARLVYDELKKLFEPIPILDKLYQPLTDPDWPSNPPYPPGTIQCSSDSWALPSPDIAIPSDVIKAATTVENYMKENNHKNWKLMGVQERKD